MIAIDIPGVPIKELDLGVTANTHFMNSGDKANWEPLETRLFIELLSDSPRVLDIGANIGWFTTIGAKIAGPRGRFYAFEPDRENFSILINNLTHHRLFNVSPFRVGLGDVDVSGQLYISADNEGDHRTSPVEGRTAVPIQIAMLDSVLEGADFIPDLIKIDIQGAETAALKGGVQTLARAGKGCAKIIEFWPGGMSGGVDEAHALADRIFSWGQDVYVCHHEAEGSIRRTSPRVLHDAIEGCIHPSTPSYLDLLIAPDDRRMERLQPFVGPDWKPWA